MLLSFLFNRKMKKSLQRYKKNTIQQSTHCIFFVFFLTYTSCLYTLHATLYTPHKPLYDQYRTSYSN